MGSLILEAFPHNSAGRISFFSVSEGKAMNVTRQRTSLGALQDLAALIVLLTTGKARLYKDDGFVPDANSVLADFTAHEADYTGYVAGGIALATPTGPYTDGVDQYADNFPTVAFQPTGPVLVSNDIRGVFFEDSANDVQEFWIFETALPMASVLDIILIDAKFVSNSIAQNVVR